MQLALLLAANRLAHADVPTSLINGVLPSPPEGSGGAVLLGSGSGETQYVLDIGRQTRALDPGIRVLGIARQGASTFHGLCHRSVGVSTDNLPPIPLRIWADIEELVAAELLDAMIVAAAARCGRSFKHERIGPSGPYISAHVEV